MYEFPWARAMFSMDIKYERYIIYIYIYSIQVHEVG